MAHIMTSLISTTLIIYLAFAVLDGLDALSCDRVAFEYGVYNICVPRYKKAMEGINYNEVCPWPTTRSYYSNLSYCIEYMVNITKCIEPSLKNVIFLDLHHIFFPLRLPEGPG
ncbi:hypothetical protein HF521_016577 [Silurus meridionalis]|uniref:Uncharacterized protein n=1 Tax=Silurus meridionalis TaxID=175797 RepID=A0A8T0BW56_SILME|nr:hypothetical protein HF521_016577 [Silurus meridionalis]